MTVLNECALRAVGHRGRNDDEPTVSAIEALKDDLEILRCALENWNGEEYDLVKLSETAIGRFQERLSVIRELHKAAIPGRTEKVLVHDGAH